MEALGDNTLVSLLHPLRFYTDGDIFALCPGLQSFVEKCKCTFIRSISSFEFFVDVRAVKYIDIFKTFESMDI